MYFSFIFNFENSAPERQINKKIYNLFDKLINQLNCDNWILLYVFWELSLFKELGFEIDLKNKKKSFNNTNESIKINGKFFKIPEVLLDDDLKTKSNTKIKEALNFNKNLLIENFIAPNNLRFPLSRNILESYYY